MPSKGGGWTHEYFIKKLDEEFPNRDYKVISKYRGSKKYIYIKSKYGYNKITPSSLFKGVKPDIKNAVYKTKYSINRFRETHGHKYCYNKFIYNGALNKSVFTCRKHGDFTQDCSSHLKGQGCKMCQDERNSILRLNNTCYFKNKSKKVHGDKYDYSKTVYKGNRHKLVITCPSHGDFIQRGGSHLQGSGCPKCAEVNSCPWSRSGYIERAKGRECMLYILECYNNEEKFIKVGITSRSIKKRYCKKKSLPYTYKVLKEIKGEASFVWDLESKLKKELTSYKYVPKKLFNGHTECFNINVKQGLLEH